MKESPALARSLERGARWVAKVASGRSLADEFARALEGYDSTGRGAILDITHGTLRRYGRAQSIVRILSHRGSSDPLVQALLWCSIYVLDAGRHGEHTVVDQAVAACGLLERWNAKGYVNAILRSYLRQREQIESRLREDAEAHYQHPGWWIELVRSAHPQHWERVLAAGNSHPPMCLRVNALRCSIDDYLLRLGAAGIAARRLEGSALLLEKPVPVDRLPGFEEGDVSVQDAGAQRVAPCLDLRDGMRVLDACAAPGGKAAQILESAKVELTALDSDGQRTARLERNLQRLALQAKVRCVDCTRVADWWDGRPFERILADVPCSASGVARRHPDLKWLRRASDVLAFAERQAAIVAALWRVLAPGGKLLYVTCSVFPGENEDVVGSFVARVPEARRLPLPDGAPPQLLPDDEHDGFYYALVEKTA